MTAGKRRTAREMAVQMLYQSDLGGSPLPNIFNTFDLAEYLLRPAGAGKRKGAPASAAEDAADDATPMPAAGAAVPPGATPLTARGPQAPAGAAAVRLGGSIAPAGATSAVADAAAAASDAAAAASDTAAATSNTAAAASNTAAAPAAGGAGGAAAAGRRAADRAEAARQRRRVEDAFQYAQALVRGTLGHREEIDAMIRGQADNWRLERMPAVDRNILRLAVYEMLYERDTPKLVVVDEAIELAKKFGSEQSGRFVNGLLDGLLKQHSFPGTLT